MSISGRESAALLKVTPRSALPGPPGDARLGLVRSGALSVVDGVPDLREAWDGFDLDTRRAVVRALWRVELVPQRSGRPGVHPDGVRMTPALDV